MSSGRACRDAHLRLRSECTSTSSPGANTWRRRGRAWRSSEKRSRLLGRKTPATEVERLKPTDLVPLFATMIAVTTAPPRSEPSLAATIATDIDVHEGQEVEVLARTSANDWYQIRLGRDIAYLPASILQQWEATELSGKTMIVMRPASLLRAPISTASMSINLPEGTEVAALAVANKWYRVDASGNIGYLASDILYEWKAIEQSKTMAVKQEVHLRKTPSLTGTSVGVAKKDQRVSVLGYMGDWYRLNIDGNHIFVPADYLRDLRCRPLYRIAKEDVTKTFEDTDWEEAWTRRVCRSAARKNVKRSMEDECEGNFGGRLGIVRTEVLDWSPPEYGLKGDCEVRVWASCTYKEERRRHAGNQCK